MDYFGKYDNEDGSFSKRRIVSLVEISTKKCIQHLGQVQDIGGTPYHILKPILKRMTSKQLSNIEEKSPHIQPKSDELWGDLVKREFPERPCIANAKQKRRKGKIQLHTGLENSEFKNMPMKSLYYRYYEERELFREDSARRLRDMTQRLKDEKSEKSIISVPQLLKDPLVRRHYMGNDNNTGTNRNSILNKARRDLRSRALMFPNRSDRPRRRDPFAEHTGKIAWPNNSGFVGKLDYLDLRGDFENPNRENLPKRTTVGHIHWEKRDTNRSSITADDATTDQEKITQRRNSVSKGKSNSEQLNRNTETSASPPAQLFRKPEVLAGEKIIRKRKTEPNIFLTNRNKKVKNQDLPKIKSQDSAPRPHTKLHKVNMIKSSIFS